MKKIRSIGIGCVVVVSIAILVFIFRPPEPDVRIMPLGDSITQGSAKADSYRRPLWDLLKGSGLIIDFVGSMRKNYPNARPVKPGFDMNHEGHWGWRTDEVLAKLDGWIKSPPPDIVLLHLGTVDVLQKQDNKDTIEEIRQIILILRKHNPNIEVFVAQIIPIAGEEEQVRELNSLIPDMVKDLTSEESPVHIVNQFKGFDAKKDTYDGIHPTEVGIVKMAKIWHSALKETLSKRKKAKAKNLHEPKQRG